METVFALATVLAVIVTLGLGFCAVIVLVHYTICLIDGKKPFGKRSRTGCRDIK